MFSPTALVGVGDDAKALRIAHHVAATPARLDHAFASNLRLNTFYRHFHNNARQKYHEGNLLLADLENHVNIDCGSYTPDGVDRVGQFVAGFMAARGATVRPVPPPIATGNEATASLQKRDHALSQTLGLTRLRPTAELASTDTSFAAGDCGTADMDAPGLVASDLLRGWAEA